MLFHHHFPTHSFISKVLRLLVKAKSLGEGGRLWTSNKLCNNEEVVYGLGLGRPNVQIPSQLPLL